jgi:Tetratricopeptide repeat
VIKTRKTILGPEHPDTLANMASLAYTYRNQGRWTEAEKLFVQVMETSKTVLGPEHPTVEWINSFALIGRISVHKASYASARPLQPPQELLDRNPFNWAIGTMQALHDAIILFFSRSGSIFQEFSANTDLRARFPAVLMKNLSRLVHN